jgi:hypothetical protein
LYLVTDGCNSGIAGVVCQGESWKNSKVAAFFPEKLNSAQQNYAVHEIEMLAGVEVMLHHRDILQDVHFTWVMEHKGLIHLMNQKSLTDHQARWIEKILGFDFEIKYVPETENVPANMLLHIYSNESPCTVRACSKYTYHDIVNNNVLDIGLISMPVFAGREALALSNDWVTRSMTKAARDAALQESTKKPETAEKAQGKHPQKQPFSSKPSREPKEVESTPQNSQKVVSVPDGGSEEPSDPVSSDLNKDKVQSNLLPTRNTEPKDDLFGQDIGTDTLSISQNISHT